MVVFAEFWRFGGGLTAVRQNGGRIKVKVENYLGKIVKVYIIAKMLGLIVRV